MSGEILDIQPSLPPECDGGVPRPGQRVSGSLAEAFGFTIDDESRLLYARNMTTINESRRKADQYLNMLITKLNF